MPGAEHEFDQKTWAEQSGKSIHLPVERGRALQSFPDSNVGHDAWTGADNELSTPEITGVTPCSMSIGNSTVKIVP